LVMGHRNALAADDEAVAVAACLVLPAAVHRVEIQQVGVGRRVGSRVVDTHEPQLRPVPGGAQRQSSDAAEAVDAYFDGHRSALRQVQCLGASMMIAMPARATAEPSRSQPEGRMPSTHHSQNIATAMYTPP